MVADARNLTTEPHYIPSEADRKLAWQADEIARLAQRLASADARVAQYKREFQRALDAVDVVFQEHSGNPEPILPDFCKLGDDKFDAVIKLAKEYKSVQQRLATAEALLREAVVACRREFVQTDGPNTEWYDATRLMRDWFERAQAAGGV